VDFVKLFNLQDEVLNEVFNITKSFYLTGGTCLNRFYYQIRYSEDLDFFCIDEYFVYEIKKIINNLKEKFSIKIEVNAKEFWLIYVNDLKIDFVDNYHEKHFGEFFRKDSMVLDSKMERDEAKEKFIFEKEDFLYRLRTFPKNRLKKINFVKPKFFENIYNNYEIFVKEIEKELF
jgi:predicted nucleotidyltransferase component of viral defense system